MEPAPTTEGSPSGSNPAPFGCSQCDRLFSTERSLRCHVKVHNDKILKCCFCEQVFNRTDTLFLHALDHISKGTLPCRAENCDVVVESMLDGEHHALSNHTLNSAVMMKCKDCPEVHLSFRKMLYHHTFKHGELKNFADEMIAQQKEFLRLKKNQNRKRSGSSNKEDVEELIEEAEKDSDIAQSTDEGNVALGGILEQLQKAMSSPDENSTETISRLSDVIAELFPLAIGEQYQCLHCLMAFTDAILWMTHLGFHDVEEPFKCTSCHRQFESRQTFALHLTYFAHGDENNE